MKFVNASGSDEGSDYGVQQMPRLARKMQYSASHSASGAGVISELNISPERFKESHAVRAYIPGHPPFYGNERGQRAQQRSRPTPHRDVVHPPSALQRHHTPSTHLAGRRLRTLRSVHPDFCFVLLFVGAKAVRIQADSQADPSRPATFPERVAATPVLIRDPKPIATTAPRDAETPPKHFLGCSVLSWWDEPRRGLLLNIKIPELIILPIYSIHLLASVLYTVAYFASPARVVRASRTGYYGSVQAQHCLTCLRRPHPHPPRHLPATSELIGSCHGLIFTTPEYCYNVTAIEPKWLFEVAPDCFKAADRNRNSQTKKRGMRKQRVSEYEKPKEWGLSKLSLKSEWQHTFDA
ncbi:hypothetical protein VTO73DRAFT_10617 [Trametes versicolor]